MGGMEGEVPVAITMPWEASRPTHDPDAGTEQDTIGRMVVSTTVLSTRSFRPRVTFRSRASCTTRSLIWSSV